MLKKRYNIPKDKHFLVTGGAGFIGSNLVEGILNLGCKVRVIDNFSTGKEENIKEFIGNENFQLIKGDIREQKDCVKACQGIDYVLHHGALGSVPKSIEDPKTTNDVNITGTLNMLIAAKKNQVKRFVFASSSSVYGDENTLPKTEDKTGIPLSPYAISKLVGELYSKIFFRLYRLPTISLRYFNVFGKKQDPNSRYAAVIPIFIKKLLSEQRPTVYGDGLQSRDFIYVEDVIDANLSACVSKRETFGEVFNIATGERTHLRELVNILCGLLNNDIHPIYEAEREGDIIHSFADISRSKTLLKFTPKRDIYSGLKESINWYEQRFK